MQIFLDYLPVLVFVGAYVITGDPFVATAAIMVAMPIMLAGHWLLKRSLGRMHVISAVLVLALGSITLYLRDVAFIAWKPTVLNWLLAAVCIGSLYIGKKPLLQRMLGEQIKMQPPHWRQLTLMWSGFFFLLGLVNLYSITTTILRPGLSSSCGDCWG